MAVSIARSSTCELEKRHCPAAARHQELGTPVDRADLTVGTVVHHLVHAVVTRPDDVTADVAIDRMAEDLIANGRSFDGGAVEYPTIPATITGRSLALDFLDRDVIPERGDVDWMEAEVLVAIDSSFKRVDRDDPLAMWNQAVDLGAIYRDEIDGEEVLVIEMTDWKGGNCSKAWFDSLQGMANAVTAVALCPEANIVRRRVISYMPWGGRYENDRDLRDQDDRDKLQDYRRAVEVAVAGHRRRQGRTPDELAQPGAGCSAGFGGCPWALVCGPLSKQWIAVQDAWPVTNVADPQAWASMYILAKAVQQEAAKRVKVTLVDTDEVVTADGGSVVGWRQNPKTKITANAPAMLAREWVEQIIGLPGGSPEAQAKAAELEAMLINAMPKSGGSSVVKLIVKRIADVIGWEEAKGLEERCLEDNSGRKLTTWKRTHEADPDLLTEQLKGSLKT